MTYGFKMANNVTDLRVTGISAEFGSLPKSTVSNAEWTEDN